MKVSEEQRRELFDRLRTHLDERTATLMLEVTVPANVDLATRGDLQELRAEVLLHLTQLDGRLTGQLTELDRKVTELDGRLTRQITELDGRLTRQITELDGRLTGRLTKLDGRLTGQITQLEQGLTGRFARLEKGLTDTLYQKVIPVIVATIALATFIGYVTG
jgi:hypothetical protein